MKKPNIKFPCPINNRACRYQRHSNGYYQFGCQTHRYELWAIDDHKYVFIKGKMEPMEPFDIKKFRIVEQSLHLNNYCIETKQDDEDETYSYIFDNSHPSILLCSIPDYRFDFFDPNLMHTIRYLLTFS